MDFIEWNLSKKAKKKHQVDVKRFQDKLRPIVIIQTK